MQTTPGAPLAQRAEPTTAGSRRKRILLLLVVAALVVALDETGKSIAVATLSTRPPLVVIPGVLALTVIRNSGAAFGIGAGDTVVFSVVALAVIVTIARQARRLHSTGWAVTLGLLLGGALGNLSDRIFRAPSVFEGHVVDWIELPHWPIFNLADASIVIGVVLAFVLSGRGIDLDGSRRGGRDESPADEGADGEPLDAGAGRGD